MTRSTCESTGHHHYHYHTHTHTHTHTCLHNLNESCLPLLPLRPTHFSSHRGRRLSWPKRLVDMPRHSLSSSSLSKYTGVMCRQLSKLVEVSGSYSKPKMAHFSRHSAQTSTNTDSSTGRQRLLMRD